MTEAPITTTFVSQVAPLGFADAVDAADRLTTTELAAPAGEARLEVKERVGDGVAGAVWYEGVLHTGSRLFPRVAVDVVVSPWSAGHTEIGLRPLSHIGPPDSFRARRFFDAAWSVLPKLNDALAAGRPTETPVVADLQIAA